MKKILGLDLGTNSIGWAVVNAEKQTINKKEINKITSIDAAGSRIIPMDAATMGDFDKGNSISQTALRTSFRGARRLRERYLLRRERLNRILKLIGFLPEHYAQAIDKYGKFVTNTEPKLPWRKGKSGRYEFIFQTSFDEMLADFRKNQPELLAAGQKVPYDWTIYYLRKKALTQAITKEELAWLLLNFNQKRGYYQLRGEDEDQKDDNISIITSQILDVVKCEKDKKYDKYWYEVKLENDLIYRAAFYNDISHWKNTNKEFVLKTSTLKDGSIKNELSFLPSFDEIDKMEKKNKDKMYAKIKLKTEKTINDTGKTVGQYIYDTLLQNPKQKIIGKLVRTIDRKFYKTELKIILERQKSFIPELQNKDLYAECLNELYPINYEHKNSIANRDFTYLFLDDILFYQRPLKSKKSLISNCPYEELTYIDKETNEKKHSPIKCIAKSHPLYQEFRLWQFIHNIRIYQHSKEIENGRLVVDADVTNEFFKNEDDITTLFEWLNNRKEVDQKAFLKYQPLGLKKNADEYRWNYVEDKSYPCNETRALMLSRLSKAGIPDKFLNKENEEALWHILYSVQDKYEIEKALKSFAAKHNLDQSFVEAFLKFPPFKSEYGAYSAKAIKKLLPLMRVGKYWDENAIDESTKNRIDKIITGECDENINTQVREKAKELTDISDFKGLPLWLVCYVVYGRHSETKEITKWETPADIDSYLKTFKQHSLRNPIVEQVITETLRTVRDIWKQTGQIDEIHVELGREMKNPADKRAKMTAQVTENENTNLRIKTLLLEFMNPEFEIENVRPYSPSQQDLLRIYEDGVLNSVSEIPENIEAIINKFKETEVIKRPSTSEVLRYKLWLEQKYRSPYTGKQISLAKLFTSAYEIEHIIPQSRYFDDSFSNKVICESEVNKLKDNQLGYEFIKNHHGEKVQLSLGVTVQIFSVDEYEKFVSDNYSKNSQSRSKMKKLLMDDIPDNFIERQLNDSRYISKVVKTLLSNIVREKNEKGEYEAEATSKNLISCNGGITDRLKKDWGMNDVWNKIVLPRFQRLNELTGSKQFTSVNTEGHEIPNMPFELQKGFNKKRIDHRHHAMDAIVIACATRDHVNLLNNEAAKPENKVNRYQLSHKLRRYEKIVVDGKERDVPKEFIKPWDTFTHDAETALANIIVSFKQNLRVINKTTNHYQHIENDKKIFIKQNKGDSWAIRKPLHKDTVFAKVNLRKIKEVRLSVAMENPKAIVEKDLKLKIIELLALGYDAKKLIKYFGDNKDSWSDINLNKIKVYFFSNDTKDNYYATRKPLDKSFDKKKIEENVTDTGIQKILLAHLEAKENNPELAFSPDGIDEMNRNIKHLNNGRNHQPIIKVRVYEMASKFAVGVKGNKSKKFVEAAQGTNLFFVVYQTVTTDDESSVVNKVRSYVTVPLNIIIDCQKSTAKDWKTTLDTILKEKEYISNDAKLLFILSPNDFVYLPTEDEQKNKIISQPLNKSRIYKMVDSCGTTVNFIPCNVANNIFSINKNEQKKTGKYYVIQDEFGIGSPQSKNQKATSGELIKTICIPIKVDRLGNIVDIYKEQL